MDSFCLVVFLVSMIFLVLYVYYGALGLLLSRLSQVKFSQDSTLDLSVLAMLGFLTNAMIHYLGIAFLGFGRSLFIFHAVVFLMATSFGAKTYVGLWRERCSSYLTYFNSLTSKHKKLFYISIFFVSAYLLNVFIPKTHGDAYLYHLIVGRIWWLNDSVVVDPTNVTTGYSWAVESGYSYLRMIFGESILHIIISQLHHLVFGLLLVMVILNSLLTKLTGSRVLAWFSILLFINPPMAQQALTAKNDGIALSLVALFAIYLFSNQSKKLLLISFFALTVKITSAIGLAFSCINYFFYTLFTRQQPALSAVGITIKAAIFSLLGVFPFVINNFLSTGNPLFPILNNVFKSTLVPESAKSVVKEMSPLSLSFFELLESTYHLFVRHPYFILLPIISYLLIKRGSKKEKKIFFSLILFGFLGWVFYQYLLGAYQTRVEERHFKFPVYTLGLGLLSGFYYLRESRAKKILTFALWGIIVTHVAVDVRIRELFQGATAVSLKEKFLNAKDVMKALDSLNKDPSFNKGDIVLSIRDASNESYFLSKGYFHHKSYTSYFLKNPELSDVSKLDELLKVSKANYILIDKSQNNYLSKIEEKYSGEVISNAGSVYILSIKKSKTKPPHKI